MSAFDAFSLPWLSALIDDSTRLEHVSGHTIHALTKMADFHSTPCSHAAVHSKKLIDMSEVLQKILLNR
jgi:hypothetical protein